MFWKNLIKRLSWLNLANIKAGLKVNKFFRSRMDKAMLKNKKKRRQLEKWSIKLDKKWVKSGGEELPEKRSKKWLKKLCRKSAIKMREETAEIVVERIVQKVRGKWMKRRSKRLVKKKIEKMFEKALEKAV